jgi:universal stress protein A
MVLHVVEVPDNYSDLSFVDLPAYERACCDESRRVLDRIITPAMRESCRVEALIASGKPYQEILHVATENAADLIVLGVQGRSLTDRLLFGSTAQHVVRQATCPVLTVRAA